MLVEDMGLQCSAFSRTISGFGGLLRIVHQGQGEKSQKIQEEQPQKGKLCVTVHFVLCKIWFSENTAGF